MNDSRFFARIRSDALRAIPDPGHGTSVGEGAAPIEPRIPSTRSPRLEGRAADTESDFVRNSSSTESSVTSSLLGLKLASRRTIGSRTGTLDAQPASGGEDLGKQVPPSPNRVANERVRSASSRSLLSALDVEPTHAGRHQETGAELGSGRQSAASDNNEPFTPSSHDQSSSFEVGLPSHVKNTAADRAVAEDVSGNDALSPEAMEASLGAEIGAATEQRTIDNHRYALGREHSETPTFSSGTRPERRDITPPHLHIGEVVIRVEEEPKTKSAKRGGSRSTPSDSQRLVRSL